jgi:hypothetical protein
MHPGGRAQPLTPAGGTFGYDDEIAEAMSEALPRAIKRLAGELLIATGGGALWFALNILISRRW